MCDCKVDDKLIESFKKEVDDKARDIDQNNEYDWFSLTLGWALGKGLNPDLAFDFALHIRYHTELG